VIRWLEFNLHLLFYKRTKTENDHQYLEGRMKWDDVRIFLAVARGGSLIAAGERLAMSPASVARHVEELERRLGVALFLRSRNGYALSDAGLAVIGDAERAEGALAALQHGATGAAASLAGTVRVAMPETFASALLMPRLTDLLVDHEGLRLEVATAVNVADLTRREADIALRLVRPSAGNVVISRIGSMSVGLYAAPDYLSRRPSALSDGGKGSSGDRLGREVPGSQGGTLAVGTAAEREPRAQRDQCRRAGCRLRERHGHRRAPLLPCRRAAGAGADRRAGGMLRPGHLDGRAPRHRGHGAYSGRS
jgi:DNA-binding transcriptional LysR family regulator